MEIVIPPRDHGPSTYRYTWDENGEVMQVTRLSDDSVSSNHVARGRQTVQWPFQSTVTDTSSTSSPSTPLQYNFSSRERAATWQPKHARGRGGSDNSSIDRNIVPDYVVNYLRGETPESMAQRRRREGGGLHGVDLAHQSQRHQSRMADFEGFYLADDSSSNQPNSINEGQWVSGQMGDEQLLTGRGQGGSRGRRWTTGWRAGIALNVFLFLVVLISGFVCLVLAITDGSLMDGKSSIYTGTCATATTIDWALHAVISVFSVIMVAGANYVFQVLTSPTRTEIVVAHSNKKWLDIGIPSVRNLGHIASSRMFLAIVVLVSAVVTQMMYNAVVFVSRTAPDARIAVVTESFINGAPFSNGTTTNNGLLSRLDLLALQQRASRQELVNITAGECFERFAAGRFDVNFDAVLVVSDRGSGTNSLVQTAGARAALVRVSTTDSRIAGLAIDASSTRYCLAQFDASASCDVVLNAPLLGVVALVNSLALVATVAVLFQASSFKPLATFGDAVASFLRDPDPTTRASCLLTKEDVWNGQWGVGEPKYWVPKTHYWLRTPSLPRWILVASIWVCSVGLAAAAFAAVVLLFEGPRGRSLTRLGEAAPQTLLSLPDMAPPAAAAVLANLPQGLLAALYYAINSTATAYWLSHESALFAAGPHRPLRVSADAEGAQTTSLYLTLPRPVSWALAVIFAGMSFVLSQSFFVVSVHLPSELAAPEETTIVALGFSGIGLLVLLGTLVLLAIAVLGAGAQKAPAATLVNGAVLGNPMAMPAGSCSAVISARCHAVPGERGLWRRALAWGVVGGGVGMEVSHCAFTAGRAGQLDMARCYA